MKNVFVMMLAGLLVVGCEKPILGDVEDDASEMGDGGNNAKNFTFTVKGDFSSPTFTRAADYLYADGSGMTNLWVFDYVGGICVQKLVQMSTDEDWGKPKMRLAYGSHHVYFVASRGDEPVLDETNHTITWGTTRDTFWKDYEVNVVSTSNGNRAVALDRVATKLKVTIDDEVPAGLAKITTTPSTWYYGIDYVSGEPTSPQRKDRIVTIPSSYVGTSGQISLTFFGLSGQSEWNADVMLTATDTDGNVIGQASIEDAPFKAGRSTEYHGALFGGDDLELSLNGVWDEPYAGAW